MATRRSPRNERALLLEHALEAVQERIESWLNQFGDRFPCWTDHGQWQFNETSKAHACDGYWPGMLWLLHEQTGLDHWREAAHHYTQLAFERDAQDHHLLAVPLYDHISILTWSEETDSQHLCDASMKDWLRLAAGKHAESFQAKGGYLASTEPESLKIETLMNVPLVLEVGLDDNDDELIAIASRHCAVTRKFLVRGDGSVAERAIFDLESGTCLRTEARCGYRNDSCWSRGLAWAIYGFARCGRILNFGPWLETAHQCVQYFIEKTAAHPVPPWDFDAPREHDEHEDSSSAAIAAVALFELAEAQQTIGPEQARRRQYLRENGLRIVEQLCGPDYLAFEDDPWQGILKHGVSCFPDQQAIDESLIWGDYFFVRALIQAYRQCRIGQGR